MALTCAGSGVSRRFLTAMSFLSVCGPHTTRYMHVVYIRDTDASVYPSTAASRLPDLSAALWLITILSLFSPGVYSCWHRGQIRSDGVKRWQIRNPQNESTANIKLLRESFAIRFLSMISIPQFFYISSGSLQKRIWLKMSIPEEESCCSGAYQGV